jgi:hypothetical protein
MTPLIADIALDGSIAGPVLLMLLVAAFFATLIAVCAGVESALTRLLHRERRAQPLNTSAVASRRTAPSRPSRSSAAATSA